MLADILNQYSDRLVITDAANNYQSHRGRVKVKLPKGKLPATDDFMADTVFIKRTSAYDIERQVFEVSEALGWHIVAEPVFLDDLDIRGVGSRYSYQDEEDEHDPLVAWRWVRGATPRHSRLKQSHWLNDAVARYATFRMLVGMGDAHYQNSIINSKARKVFSIDHEGTPMAWQQYLSDMLEPYENRVDLLATCANILAYVDEAESKLDILRPLSGENQDWFPDAFTHIRRGARSYA